MAPRRIDHDGVCAIVGKFMYRSRKDAKNSGKTSFPGDHPSAYPCGDHWHWGNLAPAVIAGFHTRDGRSREVLTQPTSAHARAAEAMRAIWAATHPNTTAA